MFKHGSRRLCRLCLGSEGELWNMFDVKGGDLGDTETLPSRIKQFLQLEILQNDNLPKWICGKCLHKIDDFANFQKQCQQNERKLLLDLKGEISNPVRVVEDATENGEDVPTDDEETEIIVIDPTQDYESSDQSLPNDNHEVGNGTLTGLLPSDAEAEYADINGSLVEDVEEEDEDEDDLKCDTFPKDASNGLQHDGSTNTGPQKSLVFTCKYCDVAFAVFSACQLHEMQDHDLQAPYACFYCGYKTAIRLSLIAHIRETHHITRPYICVQCHKGFPRRSDLKKHTFVHTGVRPYACDLCGKSFSRNTNLTKHMRIHSGFKPHNCDTCPRSFANRADLVRHKKIHVGRGSQFTCARCGNAYARKDKLYYHERICLRQLTVFDPVGSGSFDGGLLQQKQDIPPPVNLGLQLPDQMQMENAPSPDLLPEPEMISFPKVEPPPALQHMSPSPPSSKIYSCSECPKRFLSNVSLRVHQATHEAADTRRYECPQCQQYFVGKREIERHLMTHSDMKPFACKSCGMKFSRKEKLQRHERIHKRQRSFSCPNCAAKFQRRDALVSHLNVQCTPVSLTNYMAPTAAASSAPLATIDQQQLVMPFEHSMLYTTGDDSAPIDSGHI